jgi:hypothetical protein
MELDESLKDALNSQSAAARKRGEEMFLRKYENKFLVFNTRNEFVAPRNLILESEGKREIFAADTLRIFYIGYLQESMMVVKSGLVEIFKNGYYNPTQIRWGGTMSNQRVGDLLPLEYIYKSPALNKQD